MNDDNREITDVDREVGWSLPRPVVPMSPGR
jgi:hypothetical protein